MGTTQNGYTSHNRLVNSRIKIFCYNKEENTKKGLAARMEENTKQKRYDNEYVRIHYKRISLNIDKNYFQSKIIPHCKKSGIPVNTFIKQLIYDRLGNPEE